MYNYGKSVKRDVLSWIADNYTAEEVIHELDEYPYSFQQEICDACWEDDHVTGNMTGSYFYNRDRAKDAVLDNMGLLREAFSDYMEGTSIVGELFLDEKWEDMDVMIRLCVLEPAVDSVIDELLNELEYARYQWGDDEDDDDEDDEDDNEKEENEKVIDYIYGKLHPYG